MPATLSSIISRKMNRPILQFLVFASVLSLCLLSFLTVRETRRDTYREREKLFRAEQTMENHYFLDVVKSGMDNDGIFFPLEGLKKDTVIVCYYSSMSCTSCVMFAKEKMRSVVGNECVFIVYNAVKDRVREGEIAAETSPISKVDQVAYFVIENGVVKNYFIPEKKYPDFTDMYLLWVKEKYL